MQIRTAADIGKMIRAYRLHAKLTQAQLAALAGTTQDWISEAERGKPKADLGLVLRTLIALGAPIDIPPPGVTLSVDSSRTGLKDYPDIDLSVDEKPEKHR